MWRRAPPDAMRPGARIKAAIEVLDEVLNRHRPAASALADWGKSHRFAGSGDRAAIGNLVYDALRRRRSLGARMGADTPRAIALAAAPQALGLPPAAVMASADGSAYALEPLSEAERAGLVGAPAPDTPIPVLGDFPDWLEPSFRRAFGAAAAEEGAALARRAPVDLRVNTLKADRDKVLKALERFSPAATRYSPLGIRLPEPGGPGRQPNVEAEAGHGRGWYEVQDEGSQVAALMAGAGPRQQVLDLCAGAGGKTLAFAASMRNTGQVYAYDDEPARLRPIFERLKRAGARNVQVLPAGDTAALRALGARFDIVFIDAPCSGTGAWRRRPDAKWRLKPANLAQRQREQQAILALAALLVRSGGRLVYVTCSVLPEENDDQVAWFLANHSGFATLPWREAWTGVGGEPPTCASERSESLLLTPARHGTDGFYIAAMSRAQ
jgi:16S rRNA (cytosine967-C5)-methyltransferase